MSKLNENTIYVGPAVIRCCKHIDLYRVGGSHTEKTLTINHSSKNFGRAQKWIFYNLFDALNRQRQPHKVEDVEYCISLFSRRTSQGSSPMDILINVPLNSDTLGPNYRAKITEFRQLLSEVEKGDQIKN